MSASYVKRLPATSDATFVNRAESVILRELKTERLLIEIAEQMKRFDRDIGALDGALQQRPKVFHTVGVNLPIDITLGVVDP